MTRPEKLDWRKLEQKWLSLWETHHIFVANLKPGQRKFFLTVAYPYPNSPQHIGHGRTYTLTDVYARFLRMQGYNVLFPMAFHYTGTPVLAMAKRLQEQDEELLDTFTRIYHVPKEKIPELYEPVDIARYFHQEIKAGMKALGYSIDWRREFTTIDPQYSRFIEWQFETLKEKGLITRGSHPVGWCPRCGNPVGQHDTVGDVEPQIEEFTLLKFIFDGAFMPTATLRPETVFGVTNIWVNPQADYARAKVENETWIISKRAAEKLQLLNRRAHVESEFKGATLVGKTVKNPATGAGMPLLPAAFVDPAHATGVVMSVPAHAPYDYQALEDLKANTEELARYGLTRADIEAIKPLPLIRVEGYSDVPARDAVVKRNIKSQSDPKLEDATEEIYSKEFHTGVMTEVAGKYAGLPVSAAKNQLIDDFLQAKKADKMYEILNKPVICRCGAECAVKVFENQWFINYGDPDWKKLATECLDAMTVTPSEIKPEFAYTIGWLKEKACARREGLGTKIPWDRSWIIESLSDSVIYMAYYTIAGHIKERQISPDHLTREVFDYVFLGKGAPEDVSARSGVSADALNKMREEFQYFYPLDSRHSGRDLIPNHLTFFIFNHVAIFPRPLWPRQIVVNGSVLMEGKKMSKSFGNIIPIRDGVETYSADGLRLAILATSGLLQDADFSPTLARSIRERLERLYTQSLELLAETPEHAAAEHGLWEKWLLSRLQAVIKGATDALESLRVRDAVQHVFYNLDQDIQWYMKQATAAKTLQEKLLAQRVLRHVFKTRLQLLAPFTPFICEELWSMFGEKGFISQSRWPQHDPALVNPEVEESVTLLKALIEDTQNIIKATGITPATIRFYTCAEWKRKVYRMALELAAGNRLDQGSLMKTATADPEIRSRGKDAARFIQTLYKNVSTMPSDLQQRHLTLTIDEYTTVKTAASLLQTEFKAQVEVYREEDERRVDPKNRASLAAPYRPAIHIE